MTLFTIRREWRDALREEAIAELSEVGDVYVALENDDLLLASNLAHDYVPLMLLLDDLGWEPQDDRQQFELTLAAAQLASAISTLSRLALGRLDGHVARRVIEGVDQADARHCITILGACADLRGRLLFALRGAVEAAASEAEAER